MQTMREHMGTSTIEKSSMRGKDAPSNSAPNAGIKLGQESVISEAFAISMLLLR